jgi:hypothetical protein
MAGTNNFQVFAENTSNCMSDADYTDSTSRGNGVIDGLADGTLYNKAEHQATIMTAAIASIAADKGVNVSDTSLTTLKSALLSAQAYPTAGGTATAITLNLPTLVNGYSVTFIAAYSNSGASTRINGYFLYKPNTATAPTLVAGKAYTIWYNAAGNCFFVKASAEGTAVAADVLAGKTFSNDNDTGLTGTLDLSNLTPANIAYGVTINGVTGIAVISGNKTWNTPGTYTWTVPAGVTTIHLYMVSATGGAGGGGGGMGQIGKEDWTSSYYAGNSGSAGSAGGTTSFGSNSLSASSAGSGGTGEYLKGVYIVSYIGNGYNTNISNTAASQETTGTGGYIGGGHGGAGSWWHKQSTVDYYIYDTTTTYYGGGGGGHYPATNTTLDVSVTPGKTITVVVGAGGAGGAGGAYGVAKSSLGEGEYEYGNSSKTIVYSNGYSGSKGENGTNGSISISW